MENTTFKFEYKKINSANIVSDSRYQRPVDVNRVRKIVANFNPNLVNPIKVSYRNNAYWVFDGQHTMQVLIARNNGRHLPVECKVYYGMTREDEARLFSEQGGIVAKVTNVQKLKSLYEAHDVDVVGFKELLESCGFICDFELFKANKRILSLKAVFDIYMKYGKKHLETLLNVLYKAWNGEYESLKKEIIMGLDIFMRSYAGEYKIDRLIKVLSEVNPVDIVSRGKVLPTGGNRRYAMIMLGFYNKNLVSSLRLDNKF